MNTKIYTLMAVVGVTCASTFAMLEARIDTSKKFQTIENFGASDAWSANFAAQWDDTERAKLADLLFSKENDDFGNPKGIGLSLWRVNLGGGTAEQGSASKIKTAHKRAESFYAADWKSYDWNKCKGQQWLMSEAKKRGCDNFLLFSNTPPVNLTKNGFGWNNPTGESNLKADCYGKFADYMADTAKYLTDSGFNVSYISPINEPQWAWEKGTQEGCTWQNSECSKLVRELDRALGERNLDSVKIIICESERIANLYEPTFAAKARKKYPTPPNEIPGEQIKTFFDESSPFYVGNLKHLAKRINSHSYDSDRNAQSLKDERAPLAAVLEKYGIQFESSEFIMLPSMAKKSDIIGKPKATEIDEALHLARVIHADLTLTPAVAWHNWKAVEVHNCGGRGLVKLFPTDRDDLSKGGYVFDTKQLWALGNFSRFIRPNFTRVSLGNAEDVANKAFGSAWISPDGKRLVCVFVNVSKDDEKIGFDLPARFKNSKLSVYETSERTSLAKMPDSAPAVRARSVATFVFDTE